MKILVIDDIIDKIEIFKYFIEKYSKKEFDFTSANSFSSAMSFINEQFDFIICDQNLGDGLGDDFLNLYEKRWNKVKAYLYSELPHEFLIGARRCFSFDGAKNEILSDIKKLDETKFTIKKEMEIMPEIKSTFNEKLCDERHEKIDKMHGTITEQLKFYSRTSIGMLISVIGILISVIGIFIVQFFELIKKAS
jgi:hypothetical protein